MAHGRRRPETRSARKAGPRPWILYMPEPWIDSSIRTEMCQSHSSFTRLAYGRLAKAGRHKVSNRTRKHAATREVSHLGALVMTSACPTSSRGQTSYAISCVRKCHSTHRTPNSLSTCTVDRVFVSSKIVWLSKDQVAWFSSTWIELLA